MDVSVDYLFQMIGRLQVENELLRRTVTELQQQSASSNLGKREVTKEELQ